MKKLLMMAVAATVISMPAIADDMTPEQKEEKLNTKVEKVFSEADTDKNGSISKAEHTAVGDKMFTDADTNSDGSLSKEEVKAEKKKHWEEKKSK